MEGNPFLSLLPGGFLPATFKTLFPQAHIASNMKKKLKCPMIGYWLIIICQYNGELYNHYKLSEVPYLLQ